MMVCIEVEIRGTIGAGPIRVSTCRIPLKVLFHHGGEGNRQVAVHRGIAISYDYNTHIVWFVGISGG